MLAAGDKDEAIARKLRISPRTVRRVISSLMIECGADSRFQLAIAAVRLGWLSAHDLTAGHRLSGRQDNPRPGDESSTRIANRVTD